MPDGSVSNDTTASRSTRPPLPLTRLYERCWCDMVSSLLLADVLNPTFSKRKERKASGLAIAFPPSGFFDPFDQRGWESASLVRHARKIRPPPPEELVEVDAMKEVPEKEKPVVDQLEGSAWRTKARLRNLLSPVHAFNKRWFGRKNTTETANFASSPIPSTPQAPVAEEKEKEPSIQLPIPFWRLWVKLWRNTVSFFGKSYDLTPYGVPVVVDFGWGRS